MAISTRQTYAIDIEDVEYLRHGDTPLLARLFKPRGTGPFPLVVELHGGAWCRGDRLNDTVLNEALAKSGVVVVALDFRMPPQASYPGSLADIHYGIRWCKTQAAAWHGRPDRIGSMGTSSGAHQAMLLGMRPHDTRYAALPSPAGAATVDGTVGGVIMVSPARILAGGERTALPPTLCLVRTYEAGHPRPDLEEFVRQYRKAGGQIDMTVFEGEGEGLLRDLSAPVAQQALEQMITFIDQHLE
jgi:acetyl esterase/lipase